MDSSAAARAQRNLNVVRIDLAVMHQEMKSLDNLARTTGRDQDMKHTARALHHLHLAMRELDDPALFHPTLF